MMFDTWRIDDVSIETNQCFPVRKIERRFGMHLAPNKHVLGRKRDLLISLSYVRSDRFHYLFLRQINLRIQIRQAELATPSAACGHLNNPECRSLVRE